MPGVTFNSTNFKHRVRQRSRWPSAGMGVSLTAYNQQISGNFTFSQSGNNVSLQVNNLSLSVGGIVNVTQGVGSFTLGPGARAAG